MIKHINIGRRVQAACNLFCPDIACVSYDDPAVWLGCEGTLVEKGSDNLVTIEFDNGVTTYCSQSELNNRQLPKHPSLSTHFIAGAKR